MVILIYGYLASKAFWITDTESPASEVSQLRAPSLRAASSSFCCRSEAVVVTSEPGVAAVLDAPPPQATSTRIDAMASSTGSAERTSLSRPRLRQGEPLLGMVFKDDANGHPDPDLVRPAAGDVGPEHGPLVQLDQGIDVGQVGLEGGV